jgi:hypothetical protein
VILLCIYVSAPSFSEAAVFNISAGDTAGLIAAIDAANANAEADTLNLAAGTYTLTDADEEELEPGLLITTEIKVNGAASGITTIERSPAAPAFSIFHITAEGNLSLNRLIIKGGMGLVMGGAILNEEGILTVNQCTISGNSVGEEDDYGGGGIGNFFGTVTITDSSIFGNSAPVGGGVENIGGTVNISNTTISGNNAGSQEEGGTGGGVSSVGGDLSLINVTVADNNAGIAEPDPEDLDYSSGIFGGGELKNTIVAQNSHTDVIGWQDSLGNNLIGDTAGSFMTLYSSDLTGDPGLDAFTDNGTPGNGRLPLVASSRAINAADTAAAPSMDQIGTARPQESAADIGAIEYIRQQIGAIPALSDWGISAMMLLLGALSFWYLRKRRSGGTR